METRIGWSQPESEGPALETWSKTLETSFGPRHGQQSPLGREYSELKPVPEFIPLESSKGEEPKSLRCTSEVSGLEGKRGRNKSNSFTAPSVSARDTTPWVKREYTDGVIGSVMSEMYSNRLV